MISDIIESSRILFNDNFNQFVKNNNEIQLLETLTYEITYSINIENLKQSLYVLQLIILYKPEMYSIIEHIFNYSYKFINVSYARLQIYLMFCKHYNASVENRVKLNKIFIDDVLTDDIKNKLNGTIEDKYMCILKAIKYESIKIFRYACAKKCLREVLEDSLEKNAEVKREHIIQAALTTNNKEILHAIFKCCSEGVYKDVSKNILKDESEGVYKDALKSKLESNSMLSHFVHNTEFSDYSFAIRYDITSLISEESIQMYVRNDLEGFIKDLISYESINIISTGIYMFDERSFLFAFDKSSDEIIKKMIEFRTENAISNSVKRAIVKRNIEHGRRSSMWLFKELL